MDLSRTLSLSRLGVAVATAAVIAAGLLWLSNGNSSTMRDRSAVDLPAAASSSTASASLKNPDPSRPAVPAARDTVPVYYVGATPHGPRLYRELHRPRGQDLLSAAVDMAVSEPPLDPDYQMPWTDAVHAAASFDGEVITVDLTAADKPGMGVRDPFPGMTQPEAELALQQVILTAQDALGEGRIPVQFLIDGQPTDLVLGQPASAALTHDPFRQTLAMLNIDSPAEGAVIRGDTLTVHGLADAFESNVVIRLQRREGTHIVFEKPIMASGWLGGRLYPFEASIDITDLESGNYILTALTEDPLEGHIQYTNTKAITIQ